MYTEQLLVLTSAIRRIYIFLYIQNSCPSISLMHFEVNLEKMELLKDKVPLWNVLRRIAQQPASPADDDVSVPGKRPR